MDIQTRKIEFVRAFLKLNNEELISQCEKLIQEFDNKEDIEPFTIEELNKRICTSERDFDHNRYKTTKELLSKYQ